MMFHAASCSVLLSCLFLRVSGQDGALAYTPGEATHEDVRAHFTAEKSKSHSSFSARFCSFYRHRNTFLFFSTFLFSFSSPGFIFVQPHTSDISTFSHDGGLRGRAVAVWVHMLLVFAYFLIFCLFVALPGPDQGFFLILLATVAGLKVKRWYVLIHLPLECYCSMWRATGLPIKTSLSSDFASERQF